MPKIIVQREKSFVGIAMWFNIYLNGKNIAKVANGAIEEFEVPAGDHTLKAKINWSRGSKEYPFSIAEGETKTFRIAPNKTNILIVSFVGLPIAIGIFFYLRKVIELQIFMSYFIALTPILFYSFITKNKYINISEGEITF